MLLAYIANALVLPPAMFFMGNFYKLRGREINFRKLPVSVTIFSVIAFITCLQFIFPPIIKALDRNKDALLSGEIWRIISPIFIQPMGIGQCIFNGIFLIVFMPIAEFIYGNRLIVIFFVAGLAGQIFNYYWNKGGGGSSTAIYGVIGSLYTYIVFKRNKLPKGFIFLALAGFMGAIILFFYKDGHSPGLLTGGILSWLMISIQQTKALKKND